MFIKLISNFQNVYVNTILVKLMYYNTILLKNIYIKGTPFL
jgi:hypothetical protein